MKDWNVYVEYTVGLLSVGYSLNYKGEYKLIEKFDSLIEETVITEDDLPSWAVRNALLTVGGIKEFDCGGCLKA